jgi:hypothetical protein
MADGDGSHANALVEGRFGGKGKEEEEGGRVKRKKEKRGSRTAR